MSYLRGLLVLLVHLIVVPGIGIPALIINLFFSHDHVMFRAARIWGWCVHLVSGVRGRAVGLENLEGVRPAVIVSNHISDFDIFALTLFMPYPYSIPAKAPLFKVPVLGWCMRAVGMVPISRVSTSHDVDQLRRFEQLVHTRRSLLVFYPEGTRRRDGRLGTFKKGAFVTAIRHRLPLVPVIMEGAHHCHRAGAFRYFPGLYTMRVLPPIPTEGLTLDERDALIERVHALFEAEVPDDQKPHPRVPVLEEA